jgi:crossover junction endodeoxyribonuclease RusA
MILELPFPPKELSPNARLHWTAKARAVKKYRADCYLLAKMAKIKIDWEGDIHLFVNFYPPIKRRYDLDNLAARMKAGMDGIADALGVNDVRFRQHPFLHDEVVKGGKVFVTICRE